MFVQSERDLENYICEHIDRFKGFLGTIYGEDKEFSFIGRSETFLENLEFDKRIKAKRE